MEMILTIVGLVVAAVVLGAIFSPKFRQVLRIRGNEAVDNMATANERQRDRYKELMKKLPDQREKVTMIMARSTNADEELAEARKKAAELEAEALAADENGAPNSVVEELASDWQKAVEAVANKAKIAEELDAAESEARAALDETTEALKDFKTEVEQGEAKTELMEALKVSAEARRQNKSLKDSISAASEDAKAIDLALEQARADNELSKGTKAEQEVAEYRRNNKKKSALAALRAKKAAASGETPAADTTDGASD